MARRKVELFMEIHNENELTDVLNLYEDHLICAEIYCSYFGSCTALDRLFTRIKLDWSDGKMILLKVLSDEIEMLRRFRNQSEPVYMFIVKKRVTKVFRGMDSFTFADVAKSELYYFNLESQGVSTDRPFYELDEPTPDEMEWLKIRREEKEQEELSLSLRQAARQAARKRHRAELMVPHLKHLNFVLFWPHATRAHPELYEKWDENNIIMVGREEVELTKETAMDVLYAGDAPINEASIHQLLSGPALAICFQMLDTDRHFVSMVRKILYEDIIDLENDKQSRSGTAFDLYKSLSLTREEIWQKRREERLKQKEDAKEKRVRRISEMLRLKRQAKIEAIEAKKAEKEQRKLDLLKAGNLSAFDNLREESEDEEVDINVPEESPEEVEEESTGEQDESEYFPPAGLLVPGFYAPPNDIAKANGLAILFPKLVSEFVAPQSEYLPPHVLVMLEINKRYAALEAVKKYKASVIHMGIFKAKSPPHAVHIAYTVRQYDSLAKRHDSEDVKIAFMLSIQVDLALLQLMDLNPTYVSRDPISGEDDCAAMFPVHYGDEYPEFEDFDDR
ncbi:uncharacterized protein LOC116413068 [Galleria mellonella]|uniref:Uncharacterized protein LOC116413068 n=1 Tax=Galleria mellonella TaxID=7137 RepID=A0ABM3MXE6_GALME|nr:uncharacterized protein LOC116413068 [Galleria mellonella]